MKHVSDDFATRFKQAFNLNEDAAPKIGIWYYLWFNSTWRLWSMPWSVGQPGFTHVKAWHVLAEDLAKHYGVSADDLRSIPYSMPRGRIDIRDLGGGRPLDEFVIYHGDDFPDSKGASLKTIIGEFNLTSLALVGKVRDAVVEHEMMDQRHKQKLQEIIGPVQYNMS